MAKKTESAMSGDLATGPIGWRIAKLTGEKLGRIFGFNLSSGRLGQAFKGLEGSLPGPLKEAIGIGAAAIFQSPRIAADILSGVTHLDADKLHELLNEVVDSTTLSFASGAGEGSSGTPTDGDISKVIDEKLRQLEATGKLKKDDFLIKVIADSAAHVYHNRDCLACAMMQQPNQKKGQQPNTGKRLGEATLRWAIEAGYQPTNDHCCNKRVGLDLKGALSQPTDLMTCVSMLGTHFEEDAEELSKRYIAYVVAAGEDQKNALRELGAQKIWTPALVRQILLHSTDVVTLLTLLKIHAPQKPVEKPTLKSRLGNALMSVFTKGPEAPEVLAIKKTIDGFTDKAKERATKDRIQSKLVKGYWK